jgi:TolB-like protein/DNA-binding winged helix-turn-helix (wHTH) protein
MIYRFGECALDTQLYSVQRCGQSIRLGPKVFQMCLYLLEHRDRVVSREELCAQLWPGRLVNPTTLEGVIKSVRKALGDSGRVQGIILTRHSYGYRFVAGVEENPTMSSDGAAPLTSILPESPESSPVQEGFDTNGVERVEVRKGRKKSLVTRVLVAQHLESRLWSWSGGVAPLGRALVIGVLLVLVGWGLWQGLRDRTAVVLDPSRLAVLPFVDLSSEADRAYVADGMTQELISRLAQTPGLTVIARTSVMKYQGTQKDLTTIGRELGVGRILLGSVHTRDNQFRVSAELVDPANQGHLWSHEYNGQLTGLMSQPGEIAVELAQGVKMHLSVVGKRQSDLSAQLR